MLTKVVEMEIGKTYSVYISDCCVVGDFSSKLVELEVDSGYLIYAKFENGVTLTQFYNDVELIDDDSA